MRKVVIPICLALLSFAAVAPGKTVRQAQPPFALWQLGGSSFRFDAVVEKTQTTDYGPGNQVTQHWREEHHWTVTLPAPSLDVDDERLTFGPANTGGGVGTISGTFTTHYDESREQCPVEPCPETRDGTYSGTSKIGIGTRYAGLVDGRPAVTVGVGPDEDNDGMAGQGSTNQPGVTPPPDSAVPTMSFTVVLPSASTTQTVVTTGEGGDRTTITGNAVDTSKLQTLAQDSVTKTEGGDVGVGDLTCERDDDGHVLSCAGFRDYAQTRTLTAKPNANHTLEAWEGCDKVDGLVCTLSPPNSHIARARFKANPCGASIPASSPNTTLKVTLACPGALKSAATFKLPGKLLIKAKLAPDSMLFTKGKYAVSYGKGKGGNPITIRMSEESRKRLRKIGRRSVTGTVEGSVKVAGGSTSFFERKGVTVKLVKP